jgi:hypothetical protein
METRLQLVLPAWSGLFLVVLGALLFFASYFLLPVAVGACWDSCGWFYTTTWQLSLNSLSNWEFYVNGLPHLDISLVTDTILLVLFYLPLLAAMTVVAGRVGFLVWPHRALVTWGHRAWLTGSIALALMLLFVLLGAVFFAGGPQSGFLGLLVGYGLLWAGNRVSSSQPRP